MKVKKSMLMNGWVGSTTSTELTFCLGHCGMSLKWLKLDCIPAIAIENHTRVYDLNKLEIANNLEILKLLILHRFEQRISFPSVSLPALQDAVL